MTSAGRICLLRVACTALVIRVTHLAVLFLADACFRDYDSSSSGLAVWDSVFFAAIAEQGYAHEQFYAFLPLLPALAGGSPLHACCP